MLSNFTIRRTRIKQRLALYHGVVPIYMQFSNDAEETFSRALKLLLVSNISIKCSDILFFLIFFLLNVYEKSPYFRVRVIYTRDSMLLLFKVEHNLSGVRNPLTTYKFVRFFE